MPVVLYTSDWFNSHIFSLLPRKFIVPLSRNYTSQVMINRILIRIKVVQILYSYLLSRNEFRIDVAPVDASRDRRFAYSVYLDMLMLIMEFSGCRVNTPSRDFVAIDPEKALRANRVGRALADNIDLKEITYKNSADLAILKQVAQALYTRIVDSAVYRDYARKRTRTLDDDVNLWAVVMESLILKDKDVIAALRANPDFSLSGLNRGIMMAVDTLRSYNDARSTYLKALSDLKQSLEQSHKLYLSLFVLIVQLTDEQRDRIEAAKGKYLASADDLNPNTRLVDNRFADFLRNSPEIVKFTEDNKFSWVSSQGLLRNLLDSILDSELYKEYLEAPSTDWRSDCEFWRSALRNIILPGDYLAEALEAMSIFWNDDLPTVGTFVLKTIRRFAVDGPEKAATDGFLPPFKDEEDANFGASLFTLAVDHREEYRAMIDSCISSDWDPERLAFMDIVIMIAAITEILNFPAIPIPVSLNEYIEIANTYSTPRSGAFINGILFSVINRLAAEGRLSKPFGTTAPDKNVNS